MNSGGIRGSTIWPPPEAEVGPERIRRQYGLVCPSHAHRAPRSLLPHPQLFICGHLHIRRLASNGRSIKADSAAAFRSAGRICASCATGSTG